MYANYGGGLESDVDCEAAVVVIDALSEACSDSWRSLLLLIVQGLMWLERRSFCFLLLGCCGPFWHFRFPDFGATRCYSVCFCWLNLSPSCPVRCLFVGCGESSRMVHRCGRGSVAPLSSVSTMRGWYACRLCCFVGLDDGQLDLRSRHPLS